MVLGDYRDFFITVATCAATLVGLLFVAISVSTGRARDHPEVIRQFRAAASLLAFTNAFTVSLFGLVPGNNIGYPAAIVGLGGILFTAAGIQATLSLPSALQRRRPQFALVLGLLVVFGFQTVLGIELVAHPHHGAIVSGIGNVLVASLLIGIGRSWELVGDWDTGFASSIGRLIGRHAPGTEQVDPADAPPPERAPGDPGPLAEPDL